MELTIDLMASESASAKYTILGKGKIGITETAKNKETLDMLKVRYKSLASRTKYLNMYKGIKEPTKAQTSKAMDARSFSARLRKGIAQSLSALGLSGFEYRGGMKFERTLTSKTLPKGIYTLVLVKGASLGKSDRADLERLDELQDEIKDLRKQLIREYKADLDDDEEYDDDDAEAYVEDDEDMRKLLDEKYKLSKRVK
jgi:hypothetical protein